MKLAIALFAFNLLGCAVGAGQHHAPAQPSLVRDGGGATTNTGSVGGGPVVPLPHPNT